MTTDFRALCVELTDCLEKADWPHRYKIVFQQWVDIAHAALAEPEGEEPTDEEVEVWADQQGFIRGHGDHPCGFWIDDGDAGAFARAVLARWGHPAAAPVPVSERLPGPEDCDAEGRCWVYQPVDYSPEAPTWQLLFHKYASANYGTTAWLSVNALPLPAPEGGEAQP